METFGKGQYKQASRMDQFEALFNFATIGMIVTNLKGEIVNINDFAQKQFGYTKGEVLGNSVELLIPDQFRNDHIKCRADYYHEHQIRAMGHGRDLFARKKNGSIFPVE